MLASKARMLGHPIHPMLIVFPFGLLGMAAVFDIVALVSGHGLFAHVAFWMIVSGVVSGIVAAAFGIADFFGIPRGTRAWRIALLHGAGNEVVLAAFALSWGLRMGDPAAPGTLALVLSFGALLLALVTGWLGGELVDRLGVGVDPNANLNAPSSLSGEPA